MANAVSLSFLETSAHYLEHTYFPRIAEAVATLPAGDLWWRPHAGTTSVGNLLLHLSGNVRQWILSGLAGEADQRVRDSEFSARDGESAETLLAALGQTVRAAAEALRGFDEELLERPIEIQGFATTGLDAIYHVVEHFSWHTGQIAWIAKARAGEAHDLAYYDDAALARARNRPGGVE